MSLIRGECVPLTKRLITQETAQKWGYQVGEDRSGSPVQIAPYYNRDGELIAQKLRYPNKDFKFIGNPKEATLFGMNLWAPGGKKVVITEGEIDALSVSQLQGNKWPVVSVPNGAQGARKSIEKCIDWLDSFDQVVLMFDMDEPGREAAVECATLFRPGKARLAELPLKDANECLMKGKGAAVIQSIWQAREYRPDGILSITDIRSEILKPVEWGIPWPWDGLNRLTYGRRRKELHTIGAGVGIGKTDFLTQLITYNAVDLKLPTGVIFLEQAPPETGKRLAGKLKGRRFHIPDAGWTMGELEEAVRMLEENNTLHLYNHWGAADWDTIKARIIYMVQAQGCKDIFLDHVTALAAEAEDERRFLDATFADMASLAQRLDFTFYVVSHLTRPQGRDTPHEEGGQVRGKQFRGSGAIAQWSHYMWGIERNQQHEDPEMRRVAGIRCVKDRYTGQGTGEVVYMKMDSATGILKEIPPPENLSAQPVQNPFVEEGIPDF